VLTGPKGGQTTPTGGAAHRRADPRHESEDALDYPSLMAAKLDRSLLEASIRRGAMAGAITGSAYGFLILIIGALPGVLLGTLLGTAMGLAVGLLLTPFRDRIKRLWLASGIATFAVSFALTLADLVFRAGPAHVPPGIRATDAWAFWVPVGLAVIGAIAPHGLRMTRDGKVTRIYPPGPPPPRRPDLPEQSATQS
jgi:hypothetical protein